VILITGGLGFIGLHTARAILDLGDSVVLTRYRSSNVPEFLQDEVGKRVFIEPIDLNSPYDLIDILRKHHVTGICDLFVPRRGTLTPGEDYRVKMEGFLHVLEAARICDVPRVSHASSVAVYGSVGEGPLIETIPLPMTSRSDTEAYKKSEEILGYHYGRLTGIDTVFLRIGGIYGPLYNRENRVNTRMIKAAMTNTSANYEGVPGGAPYEENETDATYVRDCARGIALLTLASKLPQHAYNIGGGQRVTNRDLANAVKKSYPNAELNLQPGRRGGGGGESMDLTAIRRDVGYEPQYDLERGVTEWIEWLKTHPNEF
jgi:UDP-glucose 4-epimerase